MADVVLITGASGFIGRRLAQRLVSSHRVIAIGRTDPRLAEADWIPLDLADPEFVGRLPQGVDTVVHLAAAVDHGNDGAGAPVQYLAVNARSTELLVRWSEQHGVHRILFASTGSVYGGGLGRPYREDDALVRDGPGLPAYVASKLAGEIACRSAHDVVPIVLRPFFPYGNGQSPLRLIPRLSRSIMEGRAVTIDGSDGIATNPVHVSDVVSSFAAALDLQVPATVNIAGPEVLTLGEIVRRISRRTGRHAVIDRRADVAPKDLVGDITRMQDVLHTPRRLLSHELATGMDELFGPGGP